MSFGAVTFSQDSFSGAGGTSVIVSGFASLVTNTNVGNIAIVGTATVGIAAFTGNNETRTVGAVGSPLIIGTAIVTLGSASGTTSVGTVLPVTSAIVSTTGLSATTAIGTLGFSTTGSVTLIGVQGITAIGNLSVVSNALVSASNFQTTTAVGSFTITTTANVTPSSIVGTFTVNPPSVTTITNMVLGGHEQAVQANLSLGTTSVTTHSQVEPDSVTLTGSIGNLTLIGTANVSIAAFTGNNETRALSTVNVPSVESDANVDFTSISFVATTQFGGASAVVSADANVTLAENVQESNYDTAIYDSNFFSSSGLVVVSDVGTLSIVGTATFTLASVQGTITLNAPTVIGNAIVEPTGFQVNSSVGTLSFVGNANVSLTSTSATATLGTVSVIGNAVIEIASVVLSSFFSTNYIYTAVSAEDYNKDRTVYVDFKDNFINNVVVIEEEDRTIYIPEKQHNVRSKTLLAA